MINLCLAHQEQPQAGSTDHQYRSPEKKELLRYGSACLQLNLTPEVGEAVHGVRESSGG